MLIVTVFSYQILLFCGSIYVTNGDFTLTPVNVADVTGNFANNESEITWSDLPDITGSGYGSPEADRGSWKTYYTLMHSFVGTVFAKGIPTDLIVKAVELDQDIINNYQQYITYILGHGICVGVGLLFVIIFPIVACCFCCCRCAGKCGGKRNQSDKEAFNHCKKNFLTIMVLLATSTIIVGMAPMLDNSDRMSEVTDDIGETFEGNLEVAERYLNNTMKQVEKLVDNDLTFMETVIIRDLDNVASLVGVPLLKAIENDTNVRDTLTTAYELSADLVSVDMSLKQLNASLTNLKESVMTLDQKMKSVRSTLTDIFNDCAALPSCPSSVPDITALEPGIDTSQFPDLNSQIESIEDVVTFNLTERIVEAEAELDNIPERVDNESASVRNETKKEITKLKEEVDPFIEQLRNITNMINGPDSSINNIESQIRQYSEVIKPYDRYRHHATTGVFAVVLLVTVCSSLGVILGVLGSDGVTPDERGCASNSGGCFLMVSSMVILTLSALLMLLTTLTFALGAPLEEIVCGNLRDLDSLKLIEESYFGKGEYQLAGLILDNDSIPLTFSGLLGGCKDNKALFEVAKLETRFDLDDLLNYTKYFDIQGEIDRINIDLNSVDVYSADLADQLRDFREGLDVDFSGFYTEFEDLTSMTSLDDLIQDLEDFEASIPTSTGLTGIKSRLVTEIAEIRSIKANEYGSVLTNITSVNGSLNNVETLVASIKPRLDAVEEGLNSTDAYIQTNASFEIQKLLTSYADRLLRVVDSFVNHTKEAVRSEIGRCRPVWTVYESLLLDTLCGGLVDSWNGFWFTLGWCVFFFLPSLIFSLKLAKFYRRMDPPKQTGNKTNNQRSMSVANAWLRSNKVRHFDYDKDW